MNTDITHRVLRRKVLADTLTPVAIYQRLGNAPYSYLLESVEGGERWARFSVVGLPADEWIQVKNGEIVHQRDGVEISRHNGDPFAFLEAFHAQRHVADIPEDLPFSGGLVGYFAYDCIGYIEKRLAKRPTNDVLQLPDMLFCVSDAVVVMDNLRGEANLLAIADCRKAEGIAQAEAKLDAMQAALFAPFASAPLALGEAKAERFRPQYEMGEDGYKAVVNKIKDYVAAGDVMQVVPSQRLHIDFDRPALDLYRALRITNPSPYMYVLNMSDHEIVGSSPEILARVENRKVTVRPIAGTRKRGQTMEEDLALETDLLADEKELAEHTMLIDLGRNDIGRVCKTGSVKVTEKMGIERYSHVMHIVSNVEGELADNAGALDVFKATFPAGTLSGASKVRAMEIIDEVELSRRGIYGGAIGYWAWKGNMDLAIAIRTGLIKNGKLYAQAGAGVVYDSNPDSEWQETLNKLGALIKAASMLM